VKVNNKERLFQEEVGPPEWAREHLEEASRKEMEKTIMDTFFQMEGPFPPLEMKGDKEVEMKGEKEVEMEVENPLERMKEEALKRNKVKVGAEDKKEKEESPKKDGTSGRNPDSELF